MTATAMETGKTVPECGKTMMDSEKPGDGKITDRHRLSFDSDRYTMTERSGDTFLIITAPGTGETERCLSGDARTLSSGRVR